MQQNLKPFDCKNFNFCSSVRVNAFLTHRKLCDTNGRPYYPTWL